ncbi:MAG: DUF6807 family protein [Planctomycetota bacterium]
MNCALAILLTVSTLTAAEAKTEFAFREISPTGMQLSDGGKPVFVYNFGRVLAPGFPESMKRSCYLHPVYAPNGALLSDDFNVDHPHHRGISWMWPEVTVDGRQGDLWMVKRFQQRFVGWKARETQGETAKLAVENGWFEGDRKFVKEEVEMVVHGVKQVAGGNAQRVIDFTLIFEALDAPVRIMGTTEGKKGFGGFCFRFAPRDGGTAKTIIRSEKGLSPKDAVLGKHRWAEVAGVFQGKPAWGRIDDQEGNPGYPNNGWLLRHGFGFLNVSYPGLVPLTLEPGKPLLLKYRVTLGAGEGVP